MLINLLIAMMGDTYTRIAEIKNEWIRQVKIDGKNILSNSFNDEKINF